MTLGVERMAEHAALHGLELILLADDPSMYIDVGNTKVIQFPTKDRNALENYISENIRQIANIFSSTDSWGVAAAELREKFGFPSRISSEKLIRLRDKRWVQSQLEPEGTEHATMYPRIVKPRSGTGSMDIHLVHDSEEHRRVLEEHGSSETYVSQPYHRGPVYSAELWSNGTTSIFFGVTNRIMTAPPLFLEKVKTFPHEHGTPWEAKVEAWAKDLLAKLDYDLGLAHIEFIETAAGFELVELNARMAGAMITPAIDASTNFDPYALAVADALNNTPHVPVKREILGGHSHVSLYAEKTGTLMCVEGIETFAAYPGQPAWFAAKKSGSIITDLTSYRARIGNVVATAQTPALAQDRALAAALAVRIHIA
ncbi:ATP-grasp domain-containing protein [Allorhizobium undicola]|uniref:ATP-grasp domain-containing protein n=1 Tax=Allorhizobium undicola TaxID=78527 RepID=UPI003D34488F